MTSFLIVKLSKASIPRFLFCSHTQSWLAQGMVWSASVVTGSVPRTWGGRCIGLVDGSRADRVTGCAHHVPSKEHEGVLLSYQTEIYETVRCTTTTKGLGLVEERLTLRFFGRLDDQTWNTGCGDAFLTCQIV